MAFTPRDRGYSHTVPSDITPQSFYRSRRTLLTAIAAGSAGAVLAGWAARDARAQMARPGLRAGLAAPLSSLAGATVLEPPTTIQDATSYNNFYEFGPDKGDPARGAVSMRTSPWAVDVEGLVRKPARFGLDDLIKVAPLEERIYRLRCVEGWSMVIPWVGYSLHELIRRVEPMGSARFVEFVTQSDRSVMPGLRPGALEFPYREALRLDEAMNPLAMLAFGMYGEVLPNQNGAPVRLVVPWKYGYKSGKSLIRIRFVEHEPVTSWVRLAPQEYGFYGNVNPLVDHPRWSQATERRIGEGGLFAKRRKTLMFNGYEPQVGQMYAGMDLKKHY